MRYARDGGCCGRAAVFHFFQAWPNRQDDVMRAQCLHRTASSKSPPPVSLDVSLDRAPRRFVQLRVVATKGTPSGLGQQQTAKHGSRGASVVPAPWATPTRCQHGPARLLDGLAEREWQLACVGGRQNKLLLSETSPTARRDRVACERDEVQRYNYMGGEGLSPAAYQSTARSHHPAQDAAADVLALPRFRYPTSPGTLRMIVR